MSTPKKSYELELSYLQHQTTKKKDEKEKQLHIKDYHPGGKCLIWIKPKDQS